MQETHITPLRGLIQAAVTASALWILVPVDETSGILRLGLVALLAALAIAGLAASLSEASDKR